MTPAFLYGLIVDHVIQALTLIYSKVLSGSFVIHSASSHAAPTES